MIWESGDRELLAQRMGDRGFAILNNVLEAREIECLNAKLAAIGSPRRRAGVRHLLKNTAINELAHDPRLLGIAEQILGPLAFPFRATLFNKSPDANWLIAWHQDTALPLRERRDTSDWGPWSIKDGVTYAHAPACVLSQIVALRLHLDDSTEKNGPLRVISGSHKSGVLSDNAIEALIRECSPANCLVPAGGVLVMRPLILHASSKSLSEGNRHVLHVEYAAEATLAPGLELAIV